MEDTVPSVTVQERPSGNEIKLCSADVRGRVSNREVRRANTRGATSPSGDVSGPGCVCSGVPGLGRGFGHQWICAARRRRHHPTHLDCPALLADDGECWRHKSMLCACGQHICMWQFSQSVPHCMTS